MAQSQSVVVPASMQYSHTDVLERMLLGANYREVWSTPVRLPVFSLSQLGMEVKELGGGMQTKSLRLEDRQGTQWVLRTVDKDVTPNLPKPLRGTAAQRTVQDMISAAHPYAPLTIGRLAAAVGVKTANPRFYYIPSNPGFGLYDTIFANTVCMLEEREPSQYGEETFSTEKMSEKLLETSTFRIDQEGLLRARLLDMLVADWDRHADQWRWGIKDSQDRKFFYAVPKDRDQAYFHSNGMLIKLARLLKAKHFVGFQDDLEAIKNLNLKTWKFDATYLNDLDATDWNRIVSGAVASWNDSVIAEAVRKLPPEILTLSEKDLNTKLRKNRDDLAKRWKRYYEYISHTVKVYGSDDAETFKIEKSGDSLRVQMFRVGIEAPVYERIFKGGETKVVQIVGLGGKDKVEFDNRDTKGFRVNIELGSGQD